MGCAVGAADCAGTDTFPAASMSRPGCVQPTHPVLPAFPGPVTTKKNMVGDGDEGVGRDEGGGWRMAVEGRSRRGALMPCMAVDVWSQTLACLQC